MLKLKDNGLLRQKAYVDGAWTAARSGESFAVTNPASGEEIARVANLDAADVRAGCCQTKFIAG
jgi:succinate-semialdehyde dehydrogenase/glutarate-semialdehyde dehydrogenase